MTALETEMGRSREFFSGCRMRLESGCFLKCDSLGHPSSGILWEAGVKPRERGTIAL